MSYPIGLYVHIPVCSSLCPYCGFFKIKQSQWNEDEFVSACIHEIKRYKNSRSPIALDSIFWGGGTPTCLKKESLKLIMDEIYQTFNPTPNCENTIEANPETINDDLLTTLKEARFNRISIGIQSFIDDELLFLGRKHTRQKIHSALATLKEQSHFTYNIDLIVGLPMSTIQTIQHNLDQALNYTPHHISPYFLTIEPNTPFAKQQISLPQSDSARHQYDFIKKYLTHRRYIHYEVSAFSLASHQCRHNLKYWSHNEWIGIGPSAYSFKNKQYQTNPSNIHHYLEMSHVDIDRPSHSTLKLDFIIANLRRIQGFDLSVYNNLFQSCFLTDFKDQLRPYFQNGFLKVDNNFVSTTTKGLVILNEILLEFVP